MFYIMLGKHDHVLSAKKNATKEKRYLWSVMKKVRPEDLNGWVRLRDQRWE